MRGPFKQKSIISLVLFVFLTGTVLAQDFFVRRNVSGITPVNPPPVWDMLGELPAVAPGGAVSVTLLAHDPKDDDITFALEDGSSLPPGLSLVGDQITGTGPADGSYQFTLLALDPELQSAALIFTLVSDDVPAFSGSDDWGNFAAGASNDLTASVSASDADGIAAFRFIGDPHGLAIDNAGQVTGTPPAAGGAYSVTVEAEDAGGATAQRGYQFYANRPPVWADGGDTWGLGWVIGLQASTSFTPGTTVTDADGDGITWSIVAHPGDWSMTGATTAAGTAVGPASASLSFEVTFRADDGRGASNSTADHVYFYTTRHPFTCKDALDLGLSTGDGSYTIDPDNAGANNAAITVECDMTTDGGGWTRVIRADHSANAWNAFTSDISGASPTGFNRLGHAINRFTASSTGEDLELLINWPSGNVVPAQRIFRNAKLSNIFNKDLADNAQIDTSVDYKAPGGSYSTCNGNFYNLGDGSPWSMMNWTASSGCDSSDSDNAGIGWGLTACCSGVDRLHWLRGWAPEGDYNSDPSHPNQPAYWNGKGPFEAYIR